MELSVSQLVLVGLGNSNITSAGANQTFARLRFTQADTIFQVQETAKHCGKTWGGLDREDRVRS